MGGCRSRLLQASYNGVCLGRELTVIRDSGAIQLVSDSWVGMVTWGGQLAVNWGLPPLPATPGLGEKEREEGKACRSGAKTKGVALDLPCPAIDWQMTAFQ